MIAEEIGFYKEHRKEFITQYAGKHLVIKGMAVVGIYDSNTAAHEDAGKLHEAGTFIIEHPVDLTARAAQLKRRR